jgi:hypothetical protein
MMTKTLACVLVVSLLLALGTHPRATAAQDRTAQPGQPTQGRVWIENRGDLEAVPVTIQNMATEAPPLRVQVVGPPTAPADALNGQALGSRQLWEYWEVTIPSGQGPTTVLNAAGAEGWEITGLAVPVQGGTLVVMKRPR